MEDEWIPIEKRLPKQDKVVKTIVIYGDRKTNEQLLMLKNKLWFLPDGSMYVYYTPTHWRPL